MTLNVEPGGYRAPIAPLMSGEVPLDGLREL